MIAWRIPARRFSRALGPASLVLATACSSPSAASFVKISAPILAITHVRVIDGLGGSATDDQTLVLRDGKIRAVGSAASVRPPSDARVIDGRGRTVIPGLVGMHEHLFYQMDLTGVGAASQAAMARLYLAAGVTAIRTAGAVDFDGDLRLKRAIDAGRLPGPEIDVTSPFLNATSGAPDPEGIKRQVDEYTSRGATSIKAYRTLRGAELHAAIDEAHARGVRITGHLCAVGFEEAAEMGIDNLEHGLLVDTDFNPNKQSDICPDDSGEVWRIAEADVPTDAAIHETIGDLVRRGVAITSTLAVFETFTGDPQTTDPRLEPVLAPRLRRAFETSRAKEMDPASRSAKWWTTALWHEMQFEHTFVAAGGKLMAGVDPTGWGGVMAGFGDQRELELLVMAGFTPEQAIKIASYNGADFLYETNRLGSIQDGRQADLVLVRGDPSTRISDIRNVETVFKDGVGYDPAALIAATQGAIGAFDFTRMLRFPTSAIVLALAAGIALLVTRLVNKRRARRHRVGFGAAAPTEDQAV